MSSPLLSPVSDRAAPASVPSRQGSPSPPPSPTSSSSSSPSPPSSPLPVAVSELALERVVTGSDTSLEPPVAASGPDQTSVDAVAAGGEAAEEPESVVVPSDDISSETEQSSPAPVSGPDEVEEHPTGVTDPGVVPAGESLVTASPQPAPTIAQVPQAIGFQSLPTIVEEEEEEVAPPSLPVTTETEALVEDAEMTSAEPVSAAPISVVPPVADVPNIVLSPAEEPSTAVSNEAMADAGQEPMCDDEEMREPEPESATTQDEKMDDVGQAPEVAAQPALVSTHFGQNFGSQSEFIFGPTRGVSNPPPTQSPLSGSSSFVPAFENFSFSMESSHRPGFFSQMSPSTSTSESTMPRAGTMSQEMEFEPTRAITIDDGVMGSGSSPSPGEPSADVDMENIGSQTGEHVGCSSSHGEPLVGVHTENTNTRDGGDGGDVTVAMLEEALEEELFDEQRKSAEEKAAEARAQMMAAIEKARKQVAALEEEEDRAAEAEEERQATLARQRQGGGDAPDADAEVGSDDAMSESSVSEEDEEVNSAPSPGRVPQAFLPDASDSDDSNEDMELEDVPNPSASQPDVTPAPEQAPEP
ncbi:hypothetical protein F5X96DRAFT_645044 [Biscogniauxia mediterranea]|nr:hypothetical protein F5X96DRAFT_645044 [Biscogniauxia mediterranea]